MAEDWARNLEDDMTQSVYVDTRRAERMTVEAMLDRFQTEVTEHRKGAYVEKLRIKTLKAQYGTYTLSGLTADVVIEKATMRLRTGKGRKGKLSADTVRRELSILSDAISTARDSWKIPVKENSVHAAILTMGRSRTLAPKRKRARRLKDGEEVNLMAVRQMNPSLIKPMVRFALETTLRRNELAMMQRAHINRKDCTLLIPESKTDWKTGGEGRTIPLSPEALKILDSLPARLDGKVWGIRSDSITQAFIRLCRAAGVTDLRWHDLRHEATSRLFELGMSIMDVCVFTGHKDMNMLKRYTHPDPARIAERMAESLS